MDLTSITATVSDAVRAAVIGVDPVGARTQTEVANPVHSGCVEVRVPSGIVSYDPADMTVTVLAGTSVAELNATLADHRQEVAIDPRSTATTIGGALATGLSGRRRLRVGPVRDVVLEVRIVDGVGTAIKAGGQVVKNVTGYDIPRLFVGSFGTLGVLVQCTLRCRPLPAAAQWFATDRDPSAVRDALFRPSAVLHDGSQTHVFVEGYPDDISAEAQRAGLVGHEQSAPPLPVGAHRGRISVAPGTLALVGADLMASEVPLRWQSEFGVGTVHVACDDPQGLVIARDIARRHGGWLLREHGGTSDFDGFGIPLPNAALMHRVRTAFDPHAKLAPGRLPLNVVSSTGTQT